MGKICILTDSAAQFPQLGFSGRNDVRVVAFGVELEGALHEEPYDLRANELPPSASEALRPKLIPPTAEQFETLFLKLNQEYDEIIAVLTSASLNPIFANAKQAEEATLGRARVTVINSQTTSVGLGLMVQAAAEAVAQGYPASEVESKVRSLIPHTYMMLCTPGMSYLHYAGLLDSSQAFVGEMLGLMPIFTLEEGQVSAVEKVRNTRSLVDFMQEFVLEFDELLHIAFVQGFPQLTHEARLMREHAQDNFPNTPFSEHAINLPLATLVGPRTVGLVVQEKPGPISF